MFIRRTNVCATTKLSYEALNRQFLVGAVTSWASVGSFRYFDSSRVNF